MDSANKPHSTSARPRPLTGTRGDRRLRVLFALHYPGYLRYFDSTVRALQAGGHEITLVFDHTAKQAEGMAALPELGAPDSYPRREDRWSRPAIALRRAIDYARYLHPDFAAAEPLRARAAAALPRGLRWMVKLPTLGDRGFKRLLPWLYAVEGAIPSARRIERFLGEGGFDLVMVSPLVAAPRQADLVKSARALGIPTVLAVASWDHLTTKGLVRELPDSVLVWNSRQRDEAVRLHGVPAERIVITGAQPWDRWFTAQPSTSREEFSLKVGLPRDRPLLLFVGSTASISAPEAELAFVREWIGALRAFGDSRLADAAVLVRPHPYNPGLWGDASLADLGPAAIWPRAGANPVDESDRADYFDSIFHSSAVVGINTSAMIEAAIVGRPVLTVNHPSFRATQSGTLHFHYLLPEGGGFVTAADTIDEHLRQLSQALSAGSAGSAAAQRFVGEFVRPNGRGQTATALAAREIVAVAGATPRRARSARAAVIRTLLLPIALAADLRTAVRRGAKRARRAAGRTLGR